MKEKKNKEADWTEPEYLTWQDRLRLKEIKRLYESGEMNEAMDFAQHSCDTAVRDEIPPDIWVAMGGQLTAAGREKLRKLETSRTKKSAE